MCFAASTSRKARRIRWDALHRRPSAWQPADRWLIAHARPAFAKRIRPNGVGPGGWTFPWSRLTPTTATSKLGTYSLNAAAVARSGHDGSGKTCIRDFPRWRVEMACSGYRNWNTHLTIKPPIGRVLSDAGPGRKETEAGSILGRSRNRTSISRGGLRGRKIALEHGLRRYPRSRPGARFVATTSRAFRPTAIS